jgi:hypothetical protein
MCTRWNGRDPVEKAHEYYYLALCALEDGDQVSARKNLREALTLLQDAGANHTPEYRKAVAKLHEAQGRHHLVAVA